MKPSTPSVYFDGLGISRRAVLDRMGSESLSTLEDAAFIRSAGNISREDHDKIFGSPADTVSITRGLGNKGILELYAKLGAFLSLLSEKEMQEVLERRE